MSIAPSYDDSPGPLLEIHLQQLRVAQQRFRPIQSAINAATFNAWSVGIFGVLALPFGLFDLKTLFIAVGLLAVATNEFRGRKRLRQLDANVTTLLALNQLGLLIIITVYSTWSMYRAVFAPNPYEAELAAYPDMRDMVVGTYKLASIVIYTVLIVGTAIFQGATAAFYLSRRRHLIEYRQQTPRWIIELQQWQAAL